MNALMQLILLFTLSFCSFLVLQQLKFPASRIVGPIIAVALVQMTGFSFVIPTFLKMIFSTTFGVYLGLRFTKSSIKRLKTILGATALISILYIGITIIYGNLLTKVSSMDATTAFLAVIPGGVAESGILAVSYGADLAQVSSFQLVRFLSIVVFIPLFSKWLAKPKLHQTAPHQTPTTIKENAGQAESTENNALSSIWLFIIGGLGSILLYALHIPAGLLLGATTGVALTQLISKKTYRQPSQSIYYSAQIGMGAVIGTSFTLESIQAVSTLVMPMMLLTFLTLTTSMILGYSFSKIFHWNFMTAFMAVLPGGLSTMLILADEFDTDIVIISSMQLIRLLTAVVIIPILYQFIL